MKIVFAGGGTGGHISPALGIAEQIIGEGGECLFLASFRSAPAFADYLADLNWIRIPSAPICPRHPWTLFSSLKENLAGYRASLRVLKTAAPNLVMGLGGYPSLVSVLAARRLKLPVMFYEANSIPGRANRFLFRYGGIMLRALPPDDAFPLGARQIRVKPSLPASALTPAPVGTLEKWGLDPSCPTVLVMGGSHGARAINQGIMAVLPELKARKLRPQFIHLCGKGMDEGVREKYRRWDFPVRVFSFFDRMGWLYSLADLVVSRSGAASVAEINHWKIPAILVPYPWAVDDHQQANARILERAGAAVICPESKQKAGELGRALIELIGDPGRREKMRACASSIGSGKFDDVLEVISKHLPT